MNENSLSVKESKRKSKCPKLLFNTSPHLAPNKITQYNKNSIVHHLKTVKGVTAVLGMPKYDGQNSSGRQKHQFWRVLFDSGSDGDILFQRKGAKKNSVTYTKRITPQAWHTSMGVFQTTKQGDCELAFPKNKRVRVRPDIIEYEDKAAAPKFDLIIGTETMRALGVKLDFESNMIKIDQIELPMRNLSELQEPRHFYFQHVSPPEPHSTAELTQRVVKILVAKYEPIDLPKVVNNNYSHLTSTEKDELLDLLIKYESLFGGTLGDWKTKPVSLELKEGAIPYHGRAFPTPRIHKETLRKEVDRLVELGVLKWQGESECAAPSYPKRTK